jgi:transposase
MKLCVDPESSPEVWVADRCGAQNGHALERQLCLAHLLRDAQYAIDEGDTVFAPAFKALLLGAVAIGKRRDSLKDSTLIQYRADLERRLTNLLQVDPTTAKCRKLVKGVKSVGTTCSCSSSDATSPTPTTVPNAPCDPR